MAYKDLLEFIERLKEEDELIIIEEELDPKYEISAILREIAKKRNGKAVLIENVKGYDLKVVGNLLGSEKRIAIALDIKGDLVEEYIKRKEQPIPPKIVDKAPAKEVIIKDNIDILKELPILTYHEKDASPYITQGIIFMKDIESGFMTMGVHRLQVKDKNKLGVFLASKTSTELFRIAEEKGIPLPVAIVIGVDPSILIASVSWYPYGDKISLSGGLRGEGVELIKAENSGLMIPASAMVVLEGKILPNIREKEGPFGESTGYYITANNPVIEVETITRRKDIIYPVFEPWTHEDELLTTIAWSAIMKKELKSLFPSIQDLVASTICSNVIISIKKKDEGEARKILYGILSSNPYIKHAIVVDDDIDIYSRREVEWALSTRFQGEDDIVIITKVQGSPIDPSVKDEYLTSKVGFDATKPLKNRELFEKIKVPLSSQEKARVILKKYI